MPSFLHRQLAVGPAATALTGGAVTIDPAATIDDATSLGVDNTHTSSVSGLTVGAATITTTASISSSSSSATQSAAPENSGAAHTAISTGAIIGLTIGIFAVLAVMLVVFMTMRHRRRLRARSNSGSRRPTRKSWSRIDEPTPMQMRSTNTESVVDGKTRGGDESFLSLNSTRALLVQPPPPSRNPFIAQPPSQATSRSLQAPSGAPQLPPVARSAEDSRIPNPFSSPPASPSHSPSHSHASTYSSAHAPAPTTLLSAPRTQVTSVAASSISDYPYSFTDPDPEPARAPSFPPEPSSRFSADVASDAGPTHARLTRKPSSKAQDAHARARELRAMQDLISALDRRGAPPSAFPTIDTSNTGSSRLSRGEGLVTPGGHSVSSAKDEYVSHEEAYWTPGGDHLPPADVFRAALNMGERNTGRQ